MAAPGATAVPVLLPGGAVLGDVVQLGTGEAHTCARRRDGPSSAGGATTTVSSEMGKTPASAPAGRAR